MSLELLAFLGTALVAIAYIPQITHLVVKHCAYGISIKAWTIWLVAAVLVLPHAIASANRVFFTLQVINVVAIFLIIVFSVFHQNQVCEKHKLL